MSDHDNNEMEKIEINPVVAPDGVTLFVDKGHLLFVYPPKESEKGSHWDVAVSAETLYDLASSGADDATQMFLGQVEWIKSGDIWKVIPDSVDGRHVEPVLMAFPKELKEDAYAPLAAAASLHRIMEQMYSGRPSKLN